jgi:Holliday junction resolvase
VLESVFQAQLIKELELRFPGCVVLKNDSGYRQGIPDLLVLYQNMWAALEVKASANSPSQPNQQYYVDMLDVMSFAAFIYPENKEDILNDLQQTLEPRRPARLSRA